jgi:hypothetical protein
MLLVLITSFAGIHSLRIILASPSLMEETMATKKTKSSSSTKEADANPSDKPIVDQTIDAVVESAAAVAKVAVKSGVERMEKAVRKTRVGKIVASVASTARKAVKRGKKAKTTTAKRTPARKSAGKRGALKKTAANKTGARKVSDKKTRQRKRPARKGVSRT